jgi:lipopolysaccharide export system permease protein
MNLLDRYVSVQFLRAVFFAILAFSLMFILVDMIENLDDFLDQNVAPHIIALYYGYFLPRIFSLMVPVAVLLASLFVVGRLTNNNELTIIKCAGTSLARFMLPLLGIGMLVSCAMLVFDGWGVPRINALRLSLEREYLKKNLIADSRYNLFFQERGNRIVSLEYFSESSAVARHVQIQQFDADDPTRLVRRIDAESMRWNDQRHGWTLSKGLQRWFSTDSIGSGSERIASFDSLRLGFSVITPEIILRMQQKPEEMELGQFRDYIERQRIAGSDLDRLLVDYHGKIAFPFASVIVVFFGVPFASVKRRSGLAVQFGISVLLLFIYLVSQKLSQIFGYSGIIPSILAAWIPNLLFLLAGMIAMIRVQK